METRPGDVFPEIFGSGIGEKPIFYSLVFYSLTQKQKAIAMNNKVTIKRHDSFPDGKVTLLQISGTTMQSVELIIAYGLRAYESDIFNRTYSTITEAKAHTQALADDGWFGPRFTSGFFAEAK